MTIVIEQLTFETIIGLLPKERLTPQRVIIDASLSVETELMALDYAKVAQEIQTIYDQKHFGTVEESLVFLSTFLKEAYPFLTTIWLKIIKPDILPHCRVGAILEKKY